MATSALGMIANILSIFILCKKENLQDTSHFYLTETCVIKGVLYFLGVVDSIQQTTDISVSGGPTVPPLYLCHQSPGHSGAGSAHQPLPSAGVSLSPRSLHQRLHDGLRHH